MECMNIIQRVGIMSFRSAVLCIIRISIFLLLIGVLGFYLFSILKSAFLYNIQINSVILSCILSGIFFIYQRLFLYNKEYAKLMEYEKLSDAEIQKLKLIKPITLYITKTNNVVSQSKLQTIVSSVEKRIDDYSSFPKYISGILIFLGLLGTFWGLSHTIGNVANIIDSLGVIQGDAAESFLKLKDSLKIPLAGMGIAFGCSLFGLSGSLIIGFLLINQRRVADDFLNKVEEWVTSHTISFDVVDNMQEYHGSVFSMGLLEKSIETMYAFQNQLKDLDGNRVSLFNMQREISNKISKLTEALVMHQDIIKSLGKNQVDLQNITMSLAQKMTDTVWEKMVEKLDSIDKTMNSVVQDSVNGRSYVVETLGKDIRMISKTLSSLMRE